MRKHLISAIVLLLLIYMNGFAQVYQKSLYFESENLRNIVRGVEIDAEGNVYYAGASMDTKDYDFLAGSTPVEFGPCTAGMFGGVIAKYDSNFKLLWLKGINSSSGRVLPREIYVDANDNLLVGATFQGDLITLPENEITGISGVDGSALFAKYDKNGVLQWSKIMGNLEDTKLQSITADLSGNVFLSSAFKGDVELATGQTIHGRAENYDLFIAKYTPSGALLWSKKFFPEIGNMAIGDLKTDAEGNLYACGYASSSTINFDTDASLVAAGTGSTKGFIVKYSATGVFQWASIFGMKKTEDDSSGNFIFYDMDVDVDGNCYLVSDGDAAVTGTYNVNIKSSGGDVTDLNMGNYNATSKTKGLWVKFNPNGEIMSHFLLQVLDGNYECSMNAITVDKYGFSYIGGKGRSNNANPITVQVEGINRTPTARGGLDFLFIKLNPAGECVSFKRNGSGASSGKDEWVPTNGIALDEERNKLYLGVESQTISGKPLFVDLKYNAQVNSFFNTYSTALIDKALLAQYSLMDFDVQDVVQLNAGSSFSKTIAITGNVGTILTAGYSGTLPDGVNFDFSGNTISLSGTPTVAGTWEIYLKAEDKIGDANEATGYRADKKLVLDVKTNTKIDNPLDNNGSYMILTQVGQGQIKVSFRETDHINGRISVFNIAGQSLYSTTINSNQTVLDLHLEPCSIYLFKFEGESFNSTQKIITLN